MKMFPFENENLPFSNSKFLQRTSVLTTQAILPEASGISAKLPRLPLLPWESKTGILTSFSTPQAKKIESTAVNS